jgi:hypothetical protein
MRITLVGVIVIAGAVVVIYLLASLSRTTVPPANRLPDSPQGSLPPTMPGQGRWPSGAQ